MIDDSHHMPRPSLMEILFVIFLRLVAVSCFVYGLYYWGKLVGFTDAGTMRFDLMTTPWKVAATSLAVLFPIAALGLWLSVSWGPVLWFMAAAVEVAMYDIWSDLFVSRPLVVVAHISVAVCYCLFRLGMWLLARRNGAGRKE